MTQLEKDLRSEIARMEALPSWRRYYCEGLIANYKEQLSKLKPV